MTAPGSYDLPFWARALILLWLIGGLLLSLGNLFVWVMGPCPAFSSNTVCEWSEARAFWLFPGSQLTAVIGFVLLVYGLKKWARR